MTSAHTDFTYSVQDGVSSGSYTEALFTITVTQSSWLQSVQGKRRLLPIHNPMASPRAWAGTKLTADSLNSC